MWFGITIITTLWDANILNEQLAMYGKNYYDGSVG